MSGMMHFVTRVNFENYRSFRLAIVLEFQPGRRWFLELKLAKKRIGSHPVTIKTGPENRVRVPY